VRVLKSHFGGVEPSPLGPRIPTETLHRFWQMLAHAQGRLFHAAPLASGLGVSGAEEKAC